MNSQADYDILWRFLLQRYFSYFFHQSIQLYCSLCIYHFIYYHNFVSLHIIVLFFSFFFLHVPLFLILMYCTIKGTFLFREYLYPWHVNLKMQRWTEMSYINTFYMRESEKNMFMLFRSNFCKQKMQNFLLLKCDILKSQKKTSLSSKYYTYEIVMMSK